TSPVTSPLKVDPIMMLSIRLATSGYMKALRPSRRPSAAPRTSPSTGLDILNPPWSYGHPRLHGPYYYTFGGSPLRLDGCHRGALVSPPRDAMRRRFLTADVFTDSLFGGNQLAVIPDGRGIPTQRMQQAAREFNYSETVFVLPAESSRNTRRLRIFTPGAEIPFAGHPTIGTAFVLASIGEIPLQGEWTRIVFEEGAGRVPVRIRAASGRPVFPQLIAPRSPEFGPPPPARADLAAMLGLEAADLLDEPRGPQGVSCGLPFLILPLKN